MTKTDSRRYYPTALALYITYFVLGIAATIMGQYKQDFAALWGASKLADGSFDVSSVVAVIAAIGLGRLVAFPIAGPLSDRLGRRLSALIGCVLYAIFLLAITFAPNMYIGYVLAVISGMANSFLDTSITPSCMEIFKEKGTIANIFTKLAISIAQFLLASNMSEVLGVFFATLLGFTLLNPVHLLFINLITDCFPALALGLEKGEPDTMTRPPRDSKDGIFAGGLGFDILYQGVLITIITMTSYIIGHCMEVGYFEMPKGVSDDGMTMAFLTMSMCEIFHSFNMRSQRKSVFSLPSHNKVLWGAMVGSLALTTLVLEVPVIANAFGFTPVSWTEYGVALALAFLVLPVVELVKLIQRRAARRAK